MLYYCEDFAILAEGTLSERKKIVRSFSKFPLQGFKGVITLMQDSVIPRFRLIEMPFSVQWLLRHLHSAADSEYVELRLPAPEEGFQASR